ncbi:MAG TPA: hypothetical protein VEV61_13200 [Streptosporangiaceae bacterium]|nr:hypothetical protein [Streptosporangiaceae bacterium]
MQSATSAYLRDDKRSDSARFSITAADWPAVRVHLEELSAGRVPAAVG